MHNSPASRQEHFLTSTHSLYVQYSIDESGLEPHREQIVHCRSDESIVAS